MRVTVYRWSGLFAVLVVLPGLLVWARPASRSARSGALSEASLRAKLVDFLRQKFAIPANVQVTASPLQNSQDPAFYECLITVDNAGKKSSQAVSIAKDGHFVAMSPLLYLGPDTRAEVARSIRTYFKLGPEWQLAVGPLRDSPAPGFWLTTVTAENKGKKSNQDFYVTKDKRYAVLGVVYALRSSSETARLINTRNQPCSGPADAPVTIVEYADLECPSCARLQPFLENELLPRYANKVRVIYKDFPLPLHTWARQAAVASQCAYEIDPSAFVRYRTSIFAHQSQINVTNVRDTLLQLGEQAGINRLKLAGCMDSEASLPRVEADVKEGDYLQITETPTSFINGQMLVGFQPAKEYYSLIDKDLRLGH